MPAQLKPFQVRRCFATGTWIQEITTRLPGHEWQSARARATDTASLADLLHETAEHHDHYEKTHAEHHWWDWYASYLSARQSGDSPEKATAKESSRA